jgi:Spx/MgsR family transcriptional regulator
MKASQQAATITLYGIPNCDTVKRARAWLSAHAIDARFHDFKKDGVPGPRLASWLAALGWETVLNRRGTTWRRLDEEERAGVTDAASAERLMLAQPSLIKRPVVEWGRGEITVGFDADAWSRRRRSA